MEDLKQKLCEAFCADLQVTQFTNGLAIGTPYENRAGDRIGIYALRRSDGCYRLIDNALTVSLLETEGATLDNATRKKAFLDLLGEYKANYDEEMGEIYIDGITNHELPKMALNFSALLLRMSDLIWMTQERARNTFRDDIKALLRREFEGKASILEDEPVSPEMREITPDMVLTAAGRDPVAVFIATEDTKVWQAISLRLIADYEKHIPVSVVAILERDSAITSKVRVQADNRLDAVPRYENEPHVALQRIATEVLGRTSFH